jgi:sec-independent protein translocase protein TatC
MADTQALPPSREELSPEKMTFLEHLDELRRRIIRAVLGLFVAFVLCFTFSTQIFEFLMGPLQSVLPPGGELIATAVPEIFVLHLKMSFFVAIFLASPVWLSQVWLFIAPGLYENEKKFAVPFILFGSFFFIAGAVFAHYVMFPIAVEFFSTFGSQDVEIRLTVSEVFSFYSKVLLAAGAVFQIPTVIFSSLAWVWSAPPSSGRTSSTRSSSSLSSPPS